MDSRPKKLSYYLLGAALFIIGVIIASYGFIIPNATKSERGSYLIVGLVIVMAAFFLEDASGFRKTRKRRR